MGSKCMKWALRILTALLTAAVGNIVTFRHMFPYNSGLLLILLVVSWLALFRVRNHHIQAGRLKRCTIGCELLWVFLLSTAISIVYSILGWMGRFAIGTLTEHPGMWITNTLVIFLLELVIFWTGILFIYLNSVQLGIRWRVIGAFCGMIPIVHLIVLRKLLSTVEKEVQIENDRILLNQSRAAEKVCQTKYPILMVHGVFFRDFRYLNYWGRIPRELEKNGARIFYGNHQSAASVKDSGQEIADRIREIIQETGCEKVNIIAHSKGGLDSRYAISKCGVAPYVASLTTINTPHRGCEFADYLLSKIPEAQKNAVAKAYNATLKKLGDPAPDFLAAVDDLTASGCDQFNKLVPDVPEVYYQSVGSKLNKASGGRFPLNFSYHLVRHFDGNNDGLVGEQSFPWGQNYEFLEVPDKRGISHGDLIDLNRENFDGFDVREYYIRLVSILRKKGF